MINSHLPSGPVHPYQLGESISNFLGCLAHIFILILFRIEIYVSKQCRPRSAASDLGLHCLPRSQKWDARLIWVRMSVDTARVWNFGEASLENLSILDTDVI